MQGIYAIVNIKSNKVYVGSTKDFKRRWDEHRHALQQNGHGNPHLQASWNKYGEGFFEFMICEHVGALDNLIDREQYWLDFYRMYVDVYNIELVVDRSAMSKETRQKLSKIFTGRKLSKETKHRISEAQRGNTYTLGHTLSKEHRYKISRALSGRTVPRETCERRSKSRALRKKKESKFLLSQIIDIRRRYMLGEATMSQLANAFGITRFTVWDYIRRPPKWTGLEGISAKN